MGLNGSVQSGYSTKKRGLGKRWWGSVAKRIRKCDREGRQWQIAWCVAYSAQRAHKSVGSLRGASSRALRMRTSRKLRLAGSQLSH